MSDPEEQSKIDSPEVLNDLQVTNSNHSRLDRWRWPLALLTSISILSITGYFIFDRSQEALSESLSESFHAASAFSQRAEAVAERFRQGSITRTFIASLPSIKQAGSGRLELATLDSTERFKTKDQLKIWWDYVSLGTTTSEISVPVTYRYHLKLSDSWTLSISNQTCLVTAPRIRPTLPPSIHTGRMEKTTKNGWARFNATDQLDELEKSMTATLVQFAGDEKRLALVRDEARKTVASFVKNWLLKENQWREDRFHNVIVRFHDEPEPSPTSETVSFVRPD